MPDLIDYLDSGVLNGNPLSLPVPEGIGRELEEGALDFADEVIDYHRQRDRAFDIACDPASSSIWMWWESAVGDVIVGDRISVRREPVSYSEPVMVFGEVREPPRNGYVYVVCEDGKSVGIREDGIIRLSRRVPVPLDASTLGKYPEAPFRENQTSPAIPSSEEERHG